MMAVQENNIARQFSRAAAAYDHTASIQKQIAKAGLAMLPGNTGRVLDIGCGTGCNTWHLAQCGFIATGLDIAPGMLDYARSCYPEIEFVHGDAQRLPYEHAVFDRVFSSMALQWCSDPDEVMQQVFEVLKNRGVAGLNIMVAGSFHELDNSRRAAGLRVTTNPMFSHDDWHSAAASVGFTVRHALKKTYTDTFDDVLALLRSIKGVGAGTCLDPILDTSPDKHARQSLSRTDLLELNQAYRTFALSDGQLPLSYQVSHFILEK